MITWHGVQHHPRTEFHQSRVVELQEEYDDQMHREIYTDMRKAEAKILARFLRDILEFEQ